MRPKRAATTLVSLPLCLSHFHISWRTYSTAPRKSSLMDVKSQGPSWTTCPSTAARSSTDSSNQHGASQEVNINCHDSYTLHHSRMRVFPHLYSLFIISLGLYLVLFLVGATDRRRNFPSGINKVFLDSDSYPNGPCPSASEEPDTGRGVIEWQELSDRVANDVTLRWELAFPHVGVGARRSWEGRRFRDV